MESGVSWLAVQSPLTFRADLDRGHQFFHVGKNVSVIMFFDVIPVQAAQQKRRSQQGENNPEDR